LCTDESISSAAPALLITSGKLLVNRESRNVSSVKRPKSALQLEYKSRSESQSKDRELEGGESPIEEDLQKGSIITSGSSSLGDDTTTSETRLSSEKGTNPESVITFGC